MKLFILSPKYVASLQHIHVLLLYIQGLLGSCPGCAVRLLWKLMVKSVSLPRAEGQFLLQNCSEDQGKSNAPDFV